MVVSNELKELWLLQDRAHALFRRLNDGCPPCLDEDKVSEMQNGLLAFIEHLNEAVAANKE